jgi:hypothetical protein
LSALTRLSNILAAAAERTSAGTLAVFDRISQDSQQHTFSDEFRPVRHRLGAERGLGHKAAPAHRSDHSGRHTFVNALQKKSLFAIAAGPCSPPHYLGLDEEIPKRNVFSANPWVVSNAQSRCMIMEGFPTHSWRISYGWSCGLSLAGGDSMTALGYVRALRPARAVARLLHRSRRARPLSIGRGPLGAFNQLEPPRRARYLMAHSSDTPRLRSCYVCRAAGSQ